jgi:hypothetical protein
MSHGQTCSSGCVWLRCTIKTIGIFRAGLVESVKCKGGRVGSVRRLGRLREWTRGRGVARRASARRGGENPRGELVHGNCTLASQEARSRAVYLLCRGWSPRPARSIRCIRALSAVY